MSSSSRPSHHRRSRRCSWSGLVIEQVPNPDTPVDGTGTSTTASSSRNAPHRRLKLRPMAAWMLGGRSGEGYVSLSRSAIAAAAAASSSSASHPSSSSSGHLSQGSSHRAPHSHPPPTTETPSTRGGHHGAAQGSHHQSTEGRAWAEEGEDEDGDKESEDDDWPELAERVCTHCLRDPCQCGAMGTWRSSTERVCTRCLRDPCRCSSYSTTVAHSASDAQTSTRSRHSRHSHMSHHSRDSHRTHHHSHRSSRHSGASQRSATAPHTGASHGGDDGDGRSLSSAGFGTLGGFDTLTQLARGREDEEGAEEKRSRHYGAEKLQKKKRDSKRYSSRTNGEGSSSGLTPFVITVSPGGEKR